MTITLFPLLTLMKNLGMKQTKVRKLIADAKVDRDFYLQQLGKVYSQKVLKKLSLRDLDELLDYTIATGGI